jgi:hypothetical protein
MAVLPFLIGALGARNRIADDQDELAGTIIDTVSSNYFAESSANKNKIKAQGKVYDQLTTMYPVQVVEAFGHAGLITDNMKETLSIIQNTVKPEAIENLKNLKPEDLKFVFKNNNSAMVEATSSKENTVASNLNRGQLKNLSDLYFGNELKTGALDTTRKFLFGGPVIKQGDVAPAMLQLEKETDKIQPDLEKPDDNILEAFANVPGGPLITAGSGSDTGVSASEFRIRFNSTVDNTMTSLGLDGKYTRDVNGNIATSDFTDLEGSKFAYVTDLVNATFNSPGFDFNQFGGLSASVANIVKNNDRLISNSLKKFKMSPTSIMPIIDKEVDGKKTQQFNQSGYDQFTAMNAELIARFLNSKSLAYREYVISNFGFRQYWDKLLEDAIPAD